MSQLDGRQYAQAEKSLIGGNYDTLRNACAPPVAQSPLANVIDNLRRKVNTLEAMHEAMQQKLSPLTASVPEQPMKESGGIAGAQSSVVMELSELEYRLGILCRRFDSLIARVEV